MYRLYLMYLYIHIFTHSNLILTFVTYWCIHINRHHIMTHFVSLCDIRIRMLRAQYREFARDRRLSVEGYVVYMDDLGLLHIKQDTTQVILSGGSLLFRYETEAGGISLLDQYNDCTELTMRTTGPIFNELADQVIKTSNMRLLMDLYETFIDKFIEANMNTIFPELKSN